MLKNKQLIFFFIFFLAFIPIAYSADDQYKPYLHKPVVPEHPKLKLYGKYQTNLFPGAGTYTYPIEVPKGANNLQPSLSISYNSQSVKQRPSILGAGWTLTQNYIYRDVNFTPSNITDDEFKFILNGASYNLIYDKTDGFYHTELETFVRIQNLSNASNIYNQYWLVTLKDGTKLKLGYNSDSELTSNSGYSYALKWSLDQIEDTHSNKISYSYNENPYAQDNGSVYLSQILYNNDQKRKIEFGYENSVRPDRRRVYEQGNVLEESRRLSDISVLFNSTLVRRYNFDYASLNNESSLSSLSKIKYFGSDNSSILHTIIFGYYQSTSYYINSTTYNTSVLFSNSAGEDFGVRLIDLNNDGYIDMIQGRGATSEKKAWLNNKTGWNESNSFAPPEFFVYNADPQVGLDRGLRIADINNDGLSDLIQGWGGVRKAWLNNVTGWREDSVTWAPSIDFASSSGLDEGVQLVDFDGDGKVDLLQAKESGAVKKAYLNTGNGWKDVSSLWISPTYFVKSDGSDYGSRLVDLNGDGLVDIIEGYNFGTETKNAWLNNGSGWLKSTVWNPPDVFTSSSRTDNGMRFVDLNGDGLTDIFQDYKNGSATEREAFINNGNGWTNSSSWTSPEPFTKDGKNVGRRIGDIDGNGLGDIIIGYNDGSADIKRTLVRNSTIPYLLKNITNEYGGITYLYYSKSTLFNNTGDDGISDIGFNVWVISNVTQDNSLTLDFNVLGNTSYYYFGGKYDYNDSEFRGFNIVNETLADKTVTSHYFHQNKQLRGKEFKTETYDSSGNIFSKIENNFNFTTTNYSYFVVNLLSTSMYLHDGVSTGPKITNISYKYDAYGNILSKTTFGDVSLQGDEKYENYTYTLNTSSWILNKVNWYLLFDSNFNKLRETKYFYDNHEYGSPPSKGDLTKTELWLNTGGGNPTTRFRYDDFGNLIEQVDPLGRVTKFEYGLTDITSTYPERAINALGHKTDFIYDVGTGNLLSETKNGVTKLYEYDTFGRITKEILPYDDSDFPTRSYTYSFDGVAPESIKISQRTTSNKTIDVNYFYDGFGNFIQVKSPSDNGQVVKNILYDSLFRVKEEQNPYFESFSATLSNVSNTTNRTKYSYDPLSRIISVINPDGTNKNTTFNHLEINDYDENGNRHTYLLDAYDRIIAVTEYNTDFYLLDNETYHTTYSYDTADNLVGIRDTYGNEFNFTYDSLGRKIRLKDPDLGTWTYNYDLAGNLISQIGGGGNLITGDSYYREYNGLGQLKSVKEGNTSDGRILEEYFYDSNGDRIRVNRYSYSGGTNETIYTPYREWMQVRNSSGIFNFYYIYQEGALVARLNPDGTKYFYHPDHLGSTTLISDEQGNVVEQEFFSPYGESLTANNAEEFKLYTGQFKDTTGQYYFGARYYLVNPPIFISGDPIIQQVYDPQFLNHYAYARNNPYRLADIDGREVYVIVKETETIFPKRLEPGHIAFVVSDPDRGGYRFYSDEGPSTSDTGIKFLFNVGFTKKYTSEYAVDVGDTFEEVMPSEYYDSFRIETIEDQDRQIIDKANEIIWYSNPQEYNAFVRNSQDFVIESLAAGDVDLERRGPVPSWTYKFNKKKFEDENVRNNQQKEVEK
ncbi:VCBS repeat-containing protein, partial [Candidatus Woesearchaeota archaeon]|nr:VCBS repeat-containing protein [Candidatus Woesearchaeota archaeon]